MQWRLPCHSIFGRRNLSCKNPTVPITNHPTYRLLALCARAECDAALHQRIAKAASGVTDWSAVPSLAEVHGIAPLLYRHLTSAGVHPPPNLKRELQALVVRQRLASQVRTRVLRDILTRYQLAGVRVLALKGAALAYLLYSSPELRPMRDIDLLTSPFDLVRAQQLLIDMGFEAELPETAIAHRHLGEAKLTVDGFTITVELHHNVFEEGASPILLGMLNLTDEPISFSINNLVASTLGYEDTMWYLCQHLIESTNVFSSVGLIWVSDIVSFAERFVNEIDWKKIRQQYPLVVNTLSLMNFLTPLSETLLTRASISIGQEPHGLWDDFDKMPRTTPEEQFSRGYMRALRLGFFPSEWWLRLYYGLGATQRLNWQHRLQHLLYLARRLNHVMQRRRRKLAE